MTLAYRIGFWLSLVLLAVSLALIATADQRIEDLETNEQRQNAVITDLIDKQRRHVSITADLIDACIQAEGCPLVGLDEELTEVTADG